MNRNIWLIAVLAFIPAFLLGLLIFLTFSGWLLLFVLAAVFVISLLALQSSFVYIGELESGVVFYRDGRFARFLPPGVHFVNPLVERLANRVTKRSQTAKGTSKDLRTVEGIPVTISWSVSFKVDVFNVWEKIRFKLARSLPTAADKIVAGKALQALRHIVEQKSINELYRADATKLLEQELATQVNDRLQLRHTERTVEELAAYDGRENGGPDGGLGFENIPVRDVKIGPIQMPAQVEKQLEAAHERQLQAETAVRTLERLQRAVAAFSNTDMERLAELERLRILDESGGTLHNVVASLAHTINLENGS